MRMGHALAHVINMKRKGRRPFFPLTKMPMLMAAAKQQPAIVWTKATSPSAPIGAAIKPRGVAIRLRRVARDESESERGVIRFVFRFRRQKPFGLKDRAPTAPPHRLDHRAAIKTQDQIRSNEREKGGEDKNKSKLPGEGDGEGIGLPTHIRARFRLCGKKIKAEWLACHRLIIRVFLFLIISWR